MSDEVERTLCQLPQVHVFKIPTRKSSEGYRASDWPKEPTWTGKLKIVAKGHTAAIILMDEKNQVFAVCPVTDDGAVERTLDSGRYFVLRIKNAQDRHAFIGIAFNERNDAFDFNVALSEFKNECEREAEAAKLGDVSLSGPMKDLSLKDGEKIKIGINFKKKSSTDSADKGPQQPAGQGSGFGLLKPPPRDAGASAGIVNATNLLTNASSGSNSFATADPFASDPFTSSSTVFRSAPAAATDPFATSPFDAFESSANSSVNKNLPQTASRPQQANKGNVDLLNF